MSNVFFPATNGLGKAIPFAVKSRAPQFSTSIQRGQGGSEFRVSLWDAPRWKWTVSVPVLPDSARGDSLRTIFRFWMERRGAADSFLWVPPEDATTIANAVAGQGGRLTDIQIGVGDGAQTIFPLVRPYGSASYPYGAAAEPVPWVDTRLVSPTCKVAGSAVTISSVVADGETGGKCLQLAAAPAAGALVTATWDMAYRVRFLADSQAFEAWAWQLWRQGTFELEQAFE